MAKAAFSMKEPLFTSKLNLNLRKILIKCYILSTALCDAETWTIQKIDHKYLGSFKMNKYYIESRRTEISYTQ
jgi:hypothetical protein